MAESDSDLHSVNLRMPRIRRCADHRPSRDKSKSARDDFESAHDDFNIARDEIQFVLVTKCVLTFLTSDSEFCAAKIPK